MLKPQINQSHSVHNQLPLHNSFSRGDALNHSSSSAYSTTILRQPTFTKKSSATRTGIVKAISIPFRTKETTVQGVITVQPTIQSALHSTISGALADTVANLLGKSFVLELVSNDLNWKSVKATAHYVLLDYDLSVYTYKCDFKVPKDFGEIGAVLVENKYSNKMFFKRIVLNNGVTFTCDSWVHSKHDNPEKRVFFSDNKSYLPSETPIGLKLIRELDLESRRGNGQGERKSFERIYDYDVYNDLGNPKKDISLARQALGGKEFPYPRRCRTGREMFSSGDPSAETRDCHLFYVPLDEDFSEIKEVQFGARTLYSALHGLEPLLESIFDKDKGFPLFTDIDLLYNQGFNVPAPHKGLISLLPRLLKLATNKGNTFIKFETPETIDRDNFSWLRDEEFCRQMLAGINPCSIQLVMEWPLMSKLDPEVYGPAESAITKEMVEEKIKGFMTFEEVMQTDAKSFN